MLIIHSIFNLLRLVILFVVSALLYFFIKNKAVYFFLRFSGPSFVKLGQLLANRPDLVGDNLANHLSSFQDRLPSFSFKKIVKTIESEFSKPLKDLFVDFSSVPVACASIAQVHKAKTISGDVVAVKVLRPNIKNLMRMDIATLKLIAFIVGVFSSYFKDKILNIIQLLETCSLKELDLFCEASASAELKEKLVDVKGFYVPKVYWNLVSNKVLTTQWIEGVPFSDHELILKFIADNGFDKVNIARNLVVSYFNQVYVHGFFHADMHGGNLFLMKNGDIGVVDFGIMGVIDKKIRIAITQIVIAFLDRDYKKVAQLHIDAGLVPSNIDVNDFILSCRVIGELVVDKSVQQVSMAKLLGHLLKMTRKYQMQTKPELLLLQKTMMLVEGVGMFLDKDLNIWDLVRPFVKEWAKKNIGFDAKIRDFMLEILEVIKRYKPTI
jgi:ubiquinone biosynthesis protein